VVANEDFVQVHDGNEISGLGAVDLKTHAWYARPGALGYGVMRDRQIVCMCWYWMKDDPRTPRQLFPRLKDGEPVMVDLITAGAYRGRSYASSLIRYSEQKLHEAGYRRLWTWVWHSNHPSIRTFEKSGWKYAEFLIEVDLFRAGKILQIRLLPKRFPRFSWTANQVPVAKPTAPATPTTMNHSATKTLVEHLASNPPYASK
jgi:GNAT superfamily N-acetyltransferase